MVVLSFILAWTNTVKQPISPIQPYVPLVLLVEYNLPYILQAPWSTGPTIHWSYVPLTRRAICPTDWMHVPLVLRTIDPTP